MFFCWNSRKCEMSEVWTTSAMASAAPASCMTFWKMRWEPSRVSSQVMPSAFLLKASQTFWANDSPSDEYQTTLPSFLAASITAGSAASARAASPRARASAIRRVQSLRCAMIDVLPSSLYGSRGAPEGGGGGRHVLRAIDREQALAKRVYLGAGQRPGGIGAELRLELLDGQRVLRTAPRRILRVLQDVPVGEFHPHVSGEALRVGQARVDDVAHLARYRQDTRISRVCLAEPLDTGLAFH